MFPKAEALIQKMQLDVRYKDVTFETLNREDFLDAIKEAFPKIDWDKAYKEFRAAGEKRSWDARLRPIHRHRLLMRRDPARERLHDVPVHVCRSV